MRVFYDLEFEERGNMLPLRLISAAYVTEDGQELYVINEECLTRLLQNPWLSVNVAPSLPIAVDQRTPGNAISHWDPTHPDYDNILSMDVLVERVEGFLRAASADSKLELWGYYVAYDHVVHSQLWGDMTTLPNWLPQWSHDLMQEIERDPDFVLPPQPTPAHNALGDARWNRYVFRILNGDEPAPEPKSDVQIPVQPEDEAVLADV